MFLTESFGLQLDDLLDRICSKLQISVTQRQLAEDRYNAIGNWLSASESPLAAVKPLIYPQGSLRIGTTVHPLAHQEYDLDLVCEVQIDWRRVKNPVVLLNAVEARLSQHDTYKTMLERKNRCIRVKYAKEFHLDILPACPDSASGADCVVVPDREAKEWKPSNPKGYASWFESKARFFKVALAERVVPLPGEEPVALKAPLKLAVQLLKRWRDVTYAKDPATAPISIVLTTLAGQCYGNQESVNDALKGVLDGFVAGLPPKGRLVVLNPANLQEDLSERWDKDPTAYYAFVSGITTFQKLWRELSQRQGIPQIVAALEGLFGEDLAKSVVAEQTKAIENQRSQQKLAVQKSSGTLTSVTTVGSLPLRPNTFHGG